MANPGLTFDSLNTGGRWGQPGRLLTPAPRSIGVDFYDPTLKDDKENAGDPRPTSDEMLWGEKNYRNVNNRDCIGFYSRDAAILLVNQVNSALEGYMAGLREAYTYENTKTKKKECGLDLMTPGEVQPIVRAYLNVKKAVRELVDARTDEASIDAPFNILSVDFAEGGRSDFGDEWYQPRAASRASCCCFIFSLLLGVGSLALAGLFHTRGSDFYQDATWGNWVTVIESANFWDGSFWGWPDTKVFRNIWCGLMLGVVFGFLDNFGLFYGTSALDGTFYSIGNKIASGLLADTKAGEIIEVYNSLTYDKYTQEVALKAHTITEDMMAGLGNTFSDLLGVALGTAALEIAKAGLGVEPSWWPADLVAIVVGCLLGVFLPVLVKYSDSVASGATAWKYWLALLAILLVFASVIMVGIPADRDSDFPWTMGVSVGMMVFILLFLVAVVFGRPLAIKDRNLLAQQWSVLKTPNDERHNTQQMIDKKRLRREAQKNARKKMIQEWKSKAVQGGMELKRRVMARKPELVPLTAGDA